MMMERTFAVLFVVVFCSRRCRVTVSSVAYDGTPLLFLLERMCFCRADDDGAVGADNDFVHDYSLSLSLSRGRSLCCLLLCFAPVVVLSR